MKEQVLERVNSYRDDILTLTQTLMSIPTENPPGRAYKECVDVIEQEPELIQRVNEISGRMRDELGSMGFDTGESTTPIIPIRIGEQFKTIQAWRILFEESVFANVALPPAVPPDSSMLRLSFMATHTEEQLRRVISAFDVLKDRIKRYRRL